MNKIAGAMRNDGPPKARQRYPKIITLRSPPPLRLVIFLTKKRTLARAEIIPIRENNSGRLKSLRK